MVLIKQWSRLLGQGHLRRTSVAYKISLSLPNRQRSESKVVHSPFTDLEIPSCLVDEGIWSNLERWPDKDALVKK